jgi:O-antigen ligase
LLKTQLKENKWVLIIGIIFSILSAVAVASEFYVILGFPLVILLGYFILFKFDSLLLIMAFLVPLSVPLSEFMANTPIDMFLPTEPLLAGLLLIFLLKLGIENKFNKKLWKHPVSITIFIYLGWMFITAFTSTMVMVSIKSFISKLWFIVPFYFIVAEIFKKIDNIKKYLLAYIAGLIIVIIYATIRHATIGVFDEKVAHYACNPFYKDHTSYGAILAFFIPFALGSVFHKKHTPAIKTTYIIISVFLFTALILSYSRAAWLSLIGGLGVWIILKFRIRWYIVTSALVFISIFLILMSSQLLRDMNKNNQDSSGDLAEHVQSVTNVSSDASNVERLNRWDCAIQMFELKPIFGWGPATYMFQYAPFQKAELKTIISTNQGNVGNAHSEYFSRLSEQGLIGLLAFLSIIVTTIVYAVKNYKRTTDPLIKLLVSSSLVGLVTYYIHGVLNNFLDTDKISLPFWGFTAIIVAIDLYHNKKTNTEKL